MNTKTRIEKLEAAAAPQGHCPHLPPIVRYFAPDGSDVTDSEPQGQTDAERALTCACGRSRLNIHLQYVENWRNPDEIKAADLSDDELAAIIAREK
jgi:hypothetical protein